MNPLRGLPFFFSAKLLQLYNLYEVVRQKSNYPRGYADKISLGMEISYPVNVWLLEILSVHGCIRKKDMLQQKI